LATRCLYCGQSSGWRSLRRLLDDQFCNSSHREAYNERLRKIVTELSKYQNHCAEGTSVNSDQAMADLAIQLGCDPRLGDPVPIAPSIASPASSDPQMLPLMYLPEIALAQTDCGFVGMAPALIATLRDPAPLIVPKDADTVPTTASALESYQAQTLATLHVSDACTPSLRIGPLALNPVRLAGVKPVPSSRTLPLPMTFESEAQIERWRLRIRFQRLAHSPASA
jgi:hypothetical protein